MPAPIIAAAAWVITNGPAVALAIATWVGLALAIYMLYEVVTLIINFVKGLFNPIGPGQKNDIWKIVVWTAGAWFALKYLRSK